VTYFGFSFERHDRTLTLQEWRLSLEALWGRSSAVSGTQRELMEARIQMIYITETVDRELLVRNEYP
jgi:hypothetical protein